MWRALSYETKRLAEMKIVVCGSYGDIKGFLKVLERFQRELGKQNVFPDEQHLRESKPCIEAHHGLGEETSATLMTRSRLMKVYFRQIDLADLVVVRNEKNGKEYYGTGTAIELGYAIAKGKRILFTRKPTNSNILSLMNNLESNGKECVLKST